MTDNPSMFQSLPLMVPLYRLRPNHLWRFEPGPAPASNQSRPARKGGTRHPRHADRQARRCGVANGTSMPSPRSWLRFCSSASPCWRPPSICSQRHHSEYLWLALLCLSVAAAGAADAVFGLGQMSLTASRVFISHYQPHLHRRHAGVCAPIHGRPVRAGLVRGVQIAVLVLPFVYFIHLDAGLRGAFRCG